MICWASRDNSARRAGSVSNLPSETISSRRSLQPSAKFTNEPHPARKVIW